LTKVSSILKTYQPSVEEARRKTGPVTVRPFTADIAEDWDKFVLGQSSGTLFHLIPWMRAIKNTFGFEPCYVYSERDGKITGVAPVFLVSNWIVGRCLISTPYAVYGGVCAADSESEQALLEHLKLLAHSRETDYLELRFRQREMLPGFISNPIYYGFSTSIEPNHEANLKRLPRDTRYMIRKAAKAGLRTKRGPEQLGDFYRLFSQSMKRLGTPVFPCALFENLIKEFDGKVDLLLVSSGSKAVSGVFSFRFRDTILPYYAGAGPEAAPLAANNFMYSELMKNSAEEGCRYFDFGRSKKGTGAFAFKTQWNMDMEQFTYQVHLVQRKDLPNFSPVNPKFELATRVWKKFPLPVTTWLGPQIVRWFP
jgi:FemAB-related protein (PEP-CTERM system-associated)